MQYSAHMASLLTDIGARVRARRQARGLTIKALAERAGLSVRFLIELEKGRGNISVSRLEAVSHALDEPLVSFFVNAPLAGLMGQLLQLEKPNGGSVDTAVAQIESRTDESISFLMPTLPVDFTGGGDVEVKLKGVSYSIFSHTLDLRVVADPTPFWARRDL